jgi:hypothetical protein
MEVIIVRIVSSFIFKKLNRKTATLPFITTSKIEIEGIIEAKKYILVITTMASR